MQKITTGLAAFCLGLAASMATANDVDRKITVSGQGSVASRPDMATLTMGVTEEAKEARDAMRLTSESVAKILARLDELGIAKADVQTRRLTLNPVWSGRRTSDETPRITGFVASNSISVRIRDLPKLGEVLDQILSEGANDFSGLQFGLEDPDPVVNAAREAAVADARAKAELYARAAGVTLGDVISIAEQGGRPQPVMMEMANARDAAVPIAEGEVTVTASVSMVFEID